MESRSHALLAGIFTVCLLAAAVALSYWMNRDKSDWVFYELVSAVPVNGLSPQSGVRYQGVPVGKVLALKLDSNRPGYVWISIGVTALTPITQSTWGELGVQGVTGLSYVNLRDDGNSLQRLDSNTDHSPRRIPFRPGTLQQLEQRGNAILANVEQLSKQMKQVLSSENVQAFQTTLTNTAKLSQSLKNIAGQIERVSKQTEPLLRSLTLASEQAEHGLKEFASMTARLNHDTLPIVTNMAQNVSLAARGFATTLTRVSEAPQSFLFGYQSTQAGPGEEGFMGFAQWGSHFD